MVLSSSRIEHVVEAEVEIVVNGGGAHGCRLLSHSRVISMTPPYLLASFPGSRGHVVLLNQHSIASPQRAWRPTQKSIFEHTKNSPSPTTPPTHHHHPIVSPPSHQFKKPSVILKSIFEHQKFTILHNTTHTTRSRRGRPTMTASAQAGPG